MIKTNNVACTHSGLKQLLVVERLYVLPKNKLTQFVCKSALLKKKCWEKPRYP